MKNDIINDINEEKQNIIIESKYNSETILNDILEININNDSFINNINNDSFINNIINNIIINPFSLENLDDITVSQFRLLFTNNFNNHYKIINNLGHLIYKNKNNINFCRNNNIVIYLSRDIEIKHIYEEEFYKIFKDNLKKLCIELFHIHKNDISLDNLTEYMQYFLLCFEQMD
jgi:hypothetical protein